MLVTSGPGLVMLPGLRFGGGGVVGDGGTQSPFSSTSARHDAGEVIANVLLVPTDKIDADKFITVEKIDNLGHFTLSAQFGNSWQDDIAKLKINIDQTDIQHLLSELKKVTK